MTRPPPVPGGLRIYNLFPLLAGPLSGWGPHVERARAMGFNALFVNPVQYPGFSGSIYAIKDPYRLNPLLVDQGSASPAMDQLAAAVARIREAGMIPILDLVINHTSLDSPLVREHPAWFRRDARGRVRRPEVWEGDRRVAVWGDLAEVDNAGSEEKEALWSYWEDLALFYARLGWGGFRCDAAYKVPVALWRRLISRVRAERPGTIFLAETLGCEVRHVTALARAGFDYTFNSLKYWDLKAPWCLEQYEATRHAAPSIAFPESHDTPRLMEEAGGRVNVVRQRCLLAALFSGGVMIPVGLEFGFRRRLDVVRTRPEHWEAPTADLRGFLAEVNRLKAGHPVFHTEGPMALRRAGSPEVLCLEKQDPAGRGTALILLNRDPDRGAGARLDLHGIFREVGPGRGSRTYRGRAELDLAPAGWSVLLGERPA